MKWFTDIVGLTTSEENTPIKEASDQALSKLQQRSYLLAKIKGINKNKEGNEDNNITAEEIQNFKNAGGNLDEIINKETNETLLDRAINIGNNQAIYALKKAGAKPSKSLDMRPHVNKSIRDNQIKTKKEIQLDSISIITEDGRESPTSVANKLSPTMKKHKKLSQEAQEFQFSISESSKSTRPTVATEVNQPERPFAERAKHKVKKIEKVDLTGHEEFTPEYIIENDLIARAAMQSNLTIASSMVHKIIDSKLPGAESSIKNSLSEIITIFLDTHKQVDGPRDRAFILYNNLEKQYRTVNDMTIDSPEIIAITSTANFHKSTKRLSERALAEDLRNAQESLRSTLPTRIEETRLKYQEEKDKVTDLTQSFTETINIITDRINLTEYHAPKLDQYSAELKDIVVNAMERNKKKFSVKNNKAKIKPKTTKTISDSEAKKNIAKELPILSEEAQNCVTEYHKKFSKEKMLKLTEENSKARDSIMEEIAINYQG